MSGNSLITEISDKFLLCGICNAYYTRPKSLSCLHTYCEECLEVRYLIEEQERTYRFLHARSISCPECGLKTSIPPGGIRRLPDNVVVNQLSDVIGRRKRSLASPRKVSECEICVSASSELEQNVRWSVEVGGKGHSGHGRRKVIEASSKCLECCKEMCINCVELHRRTKVSDIFKLHFLNKKHYKPVCIHEIKTLK